MLIIITYVGALVMFGLAITSESHAGSKRHVGYFFSTWVLSFLPLVLYASREVHLWYLAIAVVCILYVGLYSANSIYKISSKVKK